MALTEVQVRKAKSRDRAYKLADEKGLYLLVDANGRRYWRFKYRYLKKEKLLALGVYPEIGLGEARKKRDVARLILDAGNDPSQERKHEKRAKLIRAENTFEAVAREWHAERRIGRWGGKPWVKGHADRVLVSLEQNIFREIGHRPIAELSAAEILHAVRVVEKRGALETARRVMQRIGSIFRYAIVTKRATYNPVPDLREGIATPVQKHYASLSEKDLPDFLRRLASYDGQALTRIGLELILLTFVRTVELRGAKMGEFDFDKAEWRIPAERMKMKRLHIVPLSTQAIALLREALSISGDRLFVFPNQSNPAKPMSENTLLYAVYRLGYHQRTTVHGLRATASTILNEMGYRADVIERQLAHGETDSVRDAYNHAEYLPERRQMMQHWADMLDAMTKGRKVISDRFEAKAA